jgi:prepilin-type N-terminal cleavage/methylation domain-containing protein
MAPPIQKDRGFSLVELLVVLAIVGVLTTVGIFTLGDRKGNAVLGVMDDIEGVVLAAQRNAMATGADVTLEATGSWTGGNFVIDGRRADPAAPATRLGSASEIFTSKYLQGQRDHLSAGVDSGAGYALALGAAPPLATVAPGNAEPFLTALGNNLCTGTGTKTVRVSGITKRFETGFCIIVTGLRGQGAVAADGPVGVIVVPANMSSVFKFYKPEGETQWRRK